MSTSNLITLNNCQYSIDEVSPYTVHIWGEHNSDPNGPEWMLQPHDPENNNQPWASPDAATSWAIKQINTAMNPPAPLANPTPTPEEIKAAQTILAASGYSVTPPTT